MGCPVLAAFSLRHRASQRFVGADPVWGRPGQSGPAPPPAILPTKVHGPGHAAAVVAPGNGGDHTCRPYEIPSTAENVRPKRKERPTAVGGQTERQGSETRAAGWPTAGNAPRASTGPPTVRRTVPPTRGHAVETRRTVALARTSSARPAISYIQPPRPSSLRLHHAGSARSALLFRPGQCTPRPSARKSRRAEPDAAVPVGFSSRGRDGAPRKTQKKTKKTGQTFSRWTNDRRRENQLIPPPLSRPRTERGSVRSGACKATDPPGQQSCKRHKVVEPPIATNLIRSRVSLTSCPT